MDFLARTATLEFQVAFSARIVLGGTCPWRAMVGTRWEGIITVVVGWSVFTGYSFH